MSDKIIFLDIDGVLRIPGKNDGWDGSTLLNAECCTLLKDILDYTGAFIVLTSSWRLQERYMDELRNRFKEYGIYWFRVAGQTEDLKNKARWHTYEELRWLEIQDYIKQKAVKNYIIIDDLDLKEFDKANFVKTKLKTGLTEGIAKICIEKLNKTKLGQS